MATTSATSSKPILLYGLHLLFRLPLLVLPITRRFTFVSLKELYLSFYFFRSGLLPITIDLDGSTSLHLWIPSHRSRHRPSLVLIHGFGGNSKWQWESQVGPLSKSFDLYIPDLVFFGKSRTEGDDRSTGFQARCVAEAMRRMGVKRYAVCGISYGGFVAYRMAAEMAEEEVEKVVIMTAGVSATEEQKREMIEREERDVFDIFLPRKPDDLMTLLRRSMYRPPRWVPRFVLHDFIEMMYKDYRKEREEMLRELLVRGAGMDPLPVLTQETLLIWGNRDTVFPLHLAHQLKRHLGEKSKLEFVEDAGHACQMENPGLVNYLIQSFILDSKTRTWQ